MRGIVVLVSVVIFVIQSEANGQQNSNELINLNLGMKDIVNGITAGGIPCKLFKQNESCQHVHCNFIKWKKISNATTDPDTGKAVFPLTADKFPAGIYKFSCIITAYFFPTFYDNIVGVFNKTSDANDPILINGVLSKYGYTVYKGSAAHAP